MQKVLLYICSLLLFGLISVHAVRLVSNNDKLYDSSEQLPINNGSTNELLELFVTIEHVEYRSKYAYLMAQYHEKYIILKAPINCKLYHLRKNRVYSVFVSPLQNNTQSYYEVFGDFHDSKSFAFNQELIFPIHVLATKNSEIVSDEFPPFPMSIKLDMLSNSIPFCAYTTQKFDMSRYQIETLNADEIYHLIVTANTDVFYNFNIELYK